MQHVQIEPHGALGIYKPGDGVTIYSSTQAPFVVRETLSRLLQLPLAQVRIKAPYLGGGFGGKSDVTIEPLLGLVLRSVPGKWCKLVLDREEVFTGTVLGRGMIGHYRTGVNQDGTLLAAEATLFWNGGGYGDYAINIVTGGGVSACGPYEIPNLKISSYGVYTNTPPVGAYRGYGHPEAHWCMERQMDIIAARLGLSPVEIRLKNCLGPGRKNCIGQVMRSHNGDLAGCIRKTAELVGMNHEKSNGKLQGRGIAAFGKFPVMPTNASSGAIVKVNRDGTIRLLIGAVEMGQGVNTAISQILATVLEVDIARIKVLTEVDTDTSPYEWQTVASHSTWAVGNAVIKASHDLISKLKETAAQIWGCNVENVTYVEGLLVSMLNDAKIKMEDLATGLVGENGIAMNAPLTGVGSFVPEGLTFLDSVTGQGNSAADWTFGCQGAEIEIKPETGEVWVRKLVTVIDAGRIINKKMAADQIKGAVIQALGAALFEKLVFSEKGVLRNGDLVDYKIPTVSDIPEDIVVEFIETPEATGPFGARGLGEHGAVAVAPAIANAVYNVLQGDLIDLHMSREAIIKLLLSLSGDNGLNKVILEETV